MNKKIFVLCLALIVFLVIVGVFGYQMFTKERETHYEYENGIVEIPIEDVDGITSGEAEKLCYTVMGEKDKDTGFLFSFGTSGAIKRNGKSFYVIRASWLVNNSHLSYIGDFFVSSDGKSIYNGISKPDEYIIEDLIWSYEQDN